MRAENEELEEITENKKIRKLLIFNTFNLQPYQKMAEEVRFELTEGVNPRRFSKPVPSATRPFLRFDCAKYSTDNGGSKSKNNS